MKGILYTWCLLGSYIYQTQQDHLVMTKYISSVRKGWIWNLLGCKNASEGDVREAQRKPNDLSRDIISYGIYLSVYAYVHIYVYILAIAMYLLFNKLRLYYSTNYVFLSSCAYLPIYHHVIICLNQ